MSSIQSLINQQYGIAKWTNCDNIIKRLRCKRKEEYNQLLPSEDMYCDTPIFACKYSQQPGYENYLALANEDGKLEILNTDSNAALPERYGIRAHNNAIFDLAWMFNKMKIVTVSGDHSSKLFDVTECDIREEKIFTGHSRSVKTVAFRTDDASIFATGGRDGHIILWDTRVDTCNYVGKTDRTIMNSHNIKMTPSKKKWGKSVQIGVKPVTGLVFQDENTLISCGAGDGLIKVWDIRKSYFTYNDEAIPKYKIPYCGDTTKNGYSNLIIDKNCTRLYANCLDSTIYCYNLNTYNPKPIMKYSGHQNNTFYIKSSLSNDGMYLVSGSSDANAYIWNTKHSNPIIKLTGHSEEVTCVAWCEKNDFSLVTCSDDITHKIWRIGTEFLPDDWEIFGKGQAEVLPLTPTTINNRKRHGLFTTSIHSRENKLIKLETLNSESFTKYSSPVNKRKLNISSISDDINVTPKRARQQLFPDLDTNQIRSPTSNLPNYVIDGQAPHLHFSPPKKKCQDWLTLLRIERKFKRAMINDDDNQLSSPTTPKQQRLNFKKTATASSAVNSSTIASTSSQNSPILNFFKVTNNVKCDNNSSSNNNKTNNCLNVPNSKSCL